MFLSDIFIVSLLGELCMLSLRKYVFRILKFAAWRRGQNMYKMCKSTHFWCIFYCSWSENISAHVRTAETDSRANVNCVDTNNSRYNTPVVNSRRDNDIQHCLHRLLSFG